MQAEQRVTANEASDREAITKTIDTYVKGGKSGKSDDMKPAFHPGATMFGYVEDQLLGGSIQNLYDWNDKNGAATELESRISSIDIAGNIAMVRLELDNWTGHKFTDMFTLLKTDGDWRIISKVFYLHPQS
jgi:hypothetical protein